MVYVEHFIGIYFYLEHQNGVAGSYPSLSMIGVSMLF